MYDNIIDKIYLSKFIQSALEVNLIKEKVKILRNYLHLYPMVYNMCEMVTQNMLRMLMENKFFRRIITDLIKCLKHLK